LAKADGYLEYFYTFSELRMNSKYESAEMVTPGASVLTYAQNNIYLEVKVPTEGRGPGEGEK
jgi:hypothetical protein